MHTHDNLAAIRLKNKYQDAATSIVGLLKSENMLDHAKIDQAQLKMQLERLVAAINTRSKAGKHKQQLTQVLAEQVAESVSATNDCVDTIVKNVKLARDRIDALEGGLTYESVFLSALQQPALRTEVGVERLIEACEQLQQDAIALKGHATSAFFIAARDIPLSIERHKEIQHTIKAMDHFESKEFTYFKVKGELKECLKELRSAKPPTHSAHTASTGSAALFARSSEKSGATDKAAAAATASPSPMD